MKKIFLETVLVFVFLLSLTGCGSGGSGDNVINDVEHTDVKTVVPTAVEESVSFSIPEKTNLTFNAGTYVLNASHYNFIDKDALEYTTVSEDGKTFSAPGLEISINESNVTIVTGDSDSTVWYDFGLQGIDENNASAEVNATITIVDEQDDQPVMLSDINVSESVIYGGSAYIKLTASDADGMTNVDVTLKDASENIIEAFTLYPDGTSTGTSVVVNEIFENLEVGEYMLIVTAYGLVDGENPVSMMSESYGISVILDQPDVFDFTNMYNQNLYTYVTSNTVTISGIATAVSFSTTQGTLVVNGVDTNSDTASMNDGDTLAVRVYTGSSYSNAIPVTVSANGVEDGFTVYTKAYVAPTPTPAEICANNGGYWDGTECFY